MDQTLVQDKNIPQGKAHRNDMLKIFAMVTMLVDHVGHMFFPKQLIFRSIGRLAVPIFAYQLAVGYSKTSNLKKYSLRLLLFAVIAHIPYSFFYNRLEFTPFRFNIIFTFLISIGLLVVYDKGIQWTKDFGKTKNLKYLLYGILMFIACIVIIILPEIISLKFQAFTLEYGFFGLSMVLLFHICRDKKLVMTLGLAALLLVWTYYRGAAHLAGYSLEWITRWLLDPKFVWQTITNRNGLIQLSGYFFAARAIFAVIPIIIFEQFQSKIKLNKYVGYVFYPLHLGILVVLALIIG